MIWPQAYEELEVTIVMDPKYVDLFLLINQHREATGHPRFKELTEAEIDHHMTLIEQHAPYGNDPWAEEA